MTEQPSLASQRWQQALGFPGKSAYKWSSTKSREQEAVVLLSAQAQKLLLCGARWSALHKFLS
jgi:hypothetical protein